MALDLSRESQNIALPEEVADEIWAKTLEDSLVMQLAERRELPGRGQEVQIIDTDAEAAWVNETDEKPVSTPVLNKKTWKGYTLAVIIPFSNQFLRDDATLYNEIVARAPQALGLKFDRTVFGLDTKPGELFDTLADSASVDIASDVWGGLVEADATIAAADGILNGWALAPAAKSLLLTAVDGVNRPLFVNSLTDDGAVERLMGQPAYFGKGVYDSSATPVQYGFAGDWTSAVYGVVEDINMSMSDQASLTYNGEQINLWQRNMTAIRFEMEVGFAVKFADHFVKLTGAAE